LHTARIRESLGLGFGNDSESERTMGSWNNNLPRLNDGTRVLIRPVRPEDKALLQQGFEAWSEHSRLMRFCAPKRELNEHELTYLTEVDGHDHAALGAMCVRAHGVLEPAGIARFVRLEPGGEVAEAAVAVTDALQGKGLGRVLLEQLAAVAREHGVTRSRCLVLEENRAMQALLASFDLDARTIKSVGGTREIEVRIPAPPRTAEATYAPFLERLRGRSASSSWSGI
jgi:GNAT superfamily N-acetyltransferase